MTLVALPLRHLLSLHHQVATPAHQMLLDLIFPDHGMPRGQALAGIGEALQKSADRLKARGFQTRMQPAAGAFMTKLPVRRGRDDFCARW